MEVVSVAIAAIALVISIIVFVDNRIREIRSARLGRRPTLVFVWDGSQRTWTLSNIGNGPALDVVIYQHIDKRWRHPLRMPEMAVQDCNVVPRRWYEEWHGDPGLGARYRSITEEEYFTKTGDDYSEVSAGWPDFSADEVIEPHWRWRNKPRGGQ